ARRIANFSGVKWCNAPRTTITFRPRKESWAGTMTRSNREGETCGSWRWTANVCGPEARLMAMAAATLRRPQEMMTRGQGGTRGVSGAAMVSGRGQKWGGRDLQG